MHSPGVTVRPLKQITAVPSFNETFFDNVRVPKENLIGGLNEGWRTAMTTLTYERGISSLATQVRIKQQLDAMIHYASKTSAMAVPVGRTGAASGLAQAHTRVEIIAAQPVPWHYESAAGQPAGPEASLDKLYWSEAGQVDARSSACHFRGRIPQLMEGPSTPSVEIGNTISCVAGRERLI